MCVSIAGWPRVVDDGEGELSVSCSLRPSRQIEVQDTSPEANWAGLGRWRESAGLGIGSGEMCPGVDGWSVCSAGFERPSLD